MGVLEGLGGSYAVAGGPGSPILTGLAVLWALTPAVPLSTQRLAVGTCRRMDGIDRELGGWHPPTHPPLGPPPTPPPQPSGCSQVRLRVLSTRVSLRSSLCRWKMSAQRMVSWKQSWGFPSMCTPPFRISARGEKSCHQHGGDGPMGTPGPTQRLGVPTQRLKGAAENVGRGCTGGVGIGQWGMILS